MNKRHIFYIALIITGGLAATIHSYLAAMKDFSMESASAMDYANWAIMLLLLILSRALPVYIAKDKSIEISFVPVVAGVMIYGVYSTVVLFFLSTFFLFSYDANKGKTMYPIVISPIKEFFNTANIILAITAGGLVLNLMGGYGDSFSIPYSILSASVFAVIAVAVNFLFFIFYFISDNDENFFVLASDIIIKMFPSVVATVPLGIFIAVLWNMENGSFFVLLFILPLLLARYSFKLYWESSSIHMRTITALTRAIEAKDPYTLGHSERVAVIAEQIAKTMGLSRKTINDLYIAALIHDIGKIGVEDSILNKPGALDKDEFDAIKNHPVIGSKIIEDVNFSKTVVEAVLYHHWGYDGKGYPAGNGEPEIQPLGAAILAIADAYDAMTSDRPYRKRLDDEVAMKIIRDNSGTQFNPKVVEAFLKVYDSKSPAITQEPA